MRLCVLDGDGRELFEVGREARVHDLDVADGERLQSVCVAHEQDFVDVVPERVGNAQAPQGKPRHAPCEACTTQTGRALQASSARPIH